MYTLVCILTLTNLSEIRAHALPYYNDISLVCELLGALVILIGFVRYLSKSQVTRPYTPRDAKALVEYKEYFTERELEKLDVPYIPRIENNTEHDVIKEVTEFLRSSEQVLIISGESGVGKTRLAIETAKRINESKKFAGNFKLRGKCLFVNLRHYKDPKSIDEKLDAELSEKMILIFDDYQYNRDLFNDVRNNAFKRNSKLIITTRPIFGEALKERIGEASIRELKLGRMDIQGILQDLEDDNLKREIGNISGGNPAITLLALDYINKFPDKSTKSIFQGIITSEEFFNKIIRDFQKEYGEDFIEFLAGGELIGGVTDRAIPPEYEKIMTEMESSGHIVEYESVYHLAPEVLSEYLINHEFFAGTFLKHSFNELAKKENGIHVLDMLNSIMKINDEREIYRKAAEEIMVTIDKLEPNTEQKKRRIKAGIAVYEGFGNLNLVTERLGEFWTDYEILEDGNDLLDLSLFLIEISKPHEARECLKKAKEIFTKNNDKIGIAATNNSLAVIYHDQGNYEEAMSLYNQSLKTFEELGDKGGVASTLHYLGNLFCDHCNYKEAMNLYNQSLRTREELGDKRGIASTLHALGTIYQDQGNYEEAMSLYNQSMKIEEELGNKSGIAITLHQLGIIHQSQGNYEEAVDLYNRSLKMKEELGDKSGIAKSLHQLGNVYYLHGNYEEAVKKYNQSLRTAEELEDKRGIALILHNTGMIHQDQGNYEKAINLYNQSMEIEEDLGNKSGIASTFHQLGMIHQDQGNYEKAIDLYNQSMKIKEELGNKSGIAVTLHQLGMIHQSRGNYEKAINFYNQSLKIKEELGDKNGIASILHNIGMIHQNQGNEEEAVKKYNQSLRTAEELGDKRGIAYTLHQLGNVHYFHGNYEESVNLYNQSLKIEEKLEDKSGVASTLHQLGMIHQDQGNYEEAVNLYNQSLKMFEELGDKSGIAKALNQLGNVYYLHGNYKEAANLYNQSLKIEEELGNKSGIARTLHNLGKIHELKKEYDFALQNYLRALSIFKELKSPSLQLTEKNISYLKDKIGEEEFNVLLENCRV